MKDLSVVRMLQQLLSAPRLGRLTRRVDAEPIPSEVQADVRTFLTERRIQLDRWFFTVRMMLGLLLMGYLTFDVVNTATISPGGMGLVLGYLLVNLSTWFASGPEFTHARWMYAASDLFFLLLLRHLFLFEALVDPNATMVGLFTLLLIAYTVYSDPVLSRTLALATILATLVTLGLDITREFTPWAGVMAYQSYPLRALLLLSYLGSFCLVTYSLALRLRRQVLNYSVELHRRMQASMTTAVERTRREKLEELNRLKHNFIAVLSHELRTPLAPLRSSLEIVREEIRHDTERVEMLDIALESTTKLQRLIQDYTQLAELLTVEHHGVLRSNIRVDVLLDILGRGTEQCRLVKEGLDQLVVSADPRLLGGALLALLRRAEMVSPPGTPVIVRGYSEEGQVVLSIHDPKSYLDPETRSSLDDPFSYSSERTFYAPNTGIELILARHSIHRLGGTLRVDSEPERGTTVYCSLPGRQYGIQWLNDTQMRFELESFF